MYNDNLPLIDMAKVCMEAWSIDVQINMTESTSSLCFTY